MGMYGLYGLYGHTLAWDHACTLYGRPYTAYMRFSVQHSIQRTPRRRSAAVRALQCLSGSSTKAAPPAIARGAIGTFYERLQWQERADALTDELVSCRAREMVAGAVVLAGACAVDGSTLHRLPPLGTFLSSPTTTACTALGRPDDMTKSAGRRALTAQRA